MWERQRPILYSQGLAPAGNCVRLLHIATEEIHAAHNKRRVANGIRACEHMRRPILRQQGCHRFDDSADVYGTRKSGRPGTRCGKYRFIWESCAARDCWSATDYPPIDKGLSLCRTPAFLVPGSHEHSTSRPRWQVRFRRQ